VIFVRKNKPRIAVVQREQVPGLPDRYTPDDLGCIKEMISEAFELSIGGIKELIGPGDRVLVKINQVEARAPEKGVTTDPRVLHALVELLFEAGAGKVQIGERSAQNGDTLANMRICGTAGVADKTGAELVPFERDGYRMVNVPNARVLSKIPVPKPILDADKYILLPKLKTHSMCKMTCAVKLQLGIMPDYNWMNLFHTEAINAKLVDILKAVHPDFVLTDSLWACQGNGPVSPFEEDKIKDFNTLIAGTDPVALDSVAAYLIGFDDPREIETTNIASADGLGTADLDKIEVKGAGIEKIRRNFRRRDLRLQGMELSHRGWEPNIQVILGGACVGCKALLRMHLDECVSRGYPEKIEKPVTVFCGIQQHPDQLPKELPGPVIIYGDCAYNSLKRIGLLDRYLKGENLVIRERPEFGLGGCCPNLGGRSWPQHDLLGFVDYVDSLIK
jgi:uncharacterized protein (DUF362 family)